MKEIIYCSKELSKKEKIKISSADCTSVATLLRSTEKVEITNVEYVVVLGADDVTPFQTAVIVTDNEKFLVSGSVAVDFIKDVSEELENDFEDITFVFDYATSKSSGNNYLSASIK